MTKKLLNKIVAKESRGSVKSIAGVFERRATDFVLFTVKVGGNYE